MGLEHVASADPPLVRIISDNPIYGAEERSAEEVAITGALIALLLSIIGYLLVNPVVLH